MSDAPKSAIELAMERLREKDRVEGHEPKPLSDGQRSAVAELRRVYEAKLAECEILYHSRLRATPEPAERATLEENYQRDRERFVTERDRKVAEARDRS